MHHAIALLALGSVVLAGCGGGGGAMLSDEPQQRPAVTPVSADTGGMEGRWMLAAPNAPPCGLMLSGGPASTEGRVTPDGGCPQRFFLVRRWQMADGTLTFIDGDGNPLGTLRQAGNIFQGRSASETPLTLAR